MCVYVCGVRQSDTLNKKNTEDTTDGNSTAVNVLKTRKRPRNGKQTASETIKGVRMVVQMADEKSNGFMKNFSHVAREHTCKQQND